MILLKGVAGFPSPSCPQIFTCHHDDPSGTVSSSDEGKSLLGISPVLLHDVLPLPRDQICQYSCFGPAYDSVHYGRGLIEPDIAIKKILIEKCHAFYLFIG